MRPMPMTGWCRPLALVLAVWAAGPAWALDPHAGHGEPTAAGATAVPHGSHPGRPEGEDATDHRPADHAGSPPPEDHAPDTRGSGGSRQGRDAHSGHDTHPGHEAHGGHDAQGLHRSHEDHLPPAPDGPDAALAPAAARLSAPTAEEVRAAFPELGPHAHMDAPLYTLALIDRLEAQDADAASALVWDARLSIGSGFDRLVLSTEGERLHGDTEEARHEGYWRHAFSRWWESRVGLRHDAGGGPGRDWLGIGVEGLAPYFVELSATAYVGEEGRSAFTLEAEYDMRLTNRLILQPRLELNAYGREDAAKGLGSGLADSEFGLRLRYEIRREFAPYIGIEWARLHGDTADGARAAGARRGDARVMAGLRLWY